MANVKFKEGYQDLGAYGMLQPIINAGGLVVDAGGDVFTTTAKIGPPPPMLTPSGTRIQYSDGALVGYKVLFYLELSGSSGYSEYLGTIENANGGPLPFFLSYKLSGVVNADFNTNSPFSNHSLVTDDDADDIIAVEYMSFDTYYYGGGFDIGFSAYDSTVATTFSAYGIWIDYEFLVSETITPKLTIY